MLRDLSPQDVFELFRSNVEANDPAIPILMAENFGGLNVYVLEGVDVREAVEEMAISAAAGIGPRYSAALLCSQAKGEIRGPDQVIREADSGLFVILTYMDHTGHSWAALRHFMRYRGVVTWLTELQVWDGPPEGGIADALSLLTEAGQ